MTIVIKRESETWPISVIAIIILSPKFIGSFESAASRLAALVCFVAVVHFVAFSILLQLFQEKKKKKRKKNKHPKLKHSLRLERNTKPQCETQGLIEDYARSNGSKLSKR